MNAALWQGGTGDFAGWTAQSIAVGTGSASATRHTGFGDAIYEFRHDLSGTVSLRGFHFGTSAQLFDPASLGRIDSISYDLDLRFWSSSGGGYHQTTATLAVEQDGRLYYATNAHVTVDSLVSGASWISPSPIAITQADFAEVTATGINVTSQPNFDFGADPIAFGIMTSNSHTVGGGHLYANFDNLVFDVTYTEAPVPAAPLGVALLSGVVALSAVRVRGRR